MNIQEAFKVQAKSDFAIYTKLNKLQVNDCHQMHYLMMACEKLSNSFASFGATHYVIKSFIQSCDNSPDIRKHLGFHLNKNAFINKKKQLLKVAEQFEKWVPKSNDTSAKNTEYPFESPPNSGNFISPHSQKFNEISPIDLKAMISFLSQMINYQP